MEKKSLDLGFIWKVRLSLYAEGNKLRAERDKLYAEGDKLYAEGDKLRAEGNKLRAEGNKLWAEAVIEVYGNIKLEWKNWDSKTQSYECHLETGEVFRP
mgnify:CR=1 FL=1